jgi:uncharacterized membrane protein
MTQKPPRLYFIDSVRGLAVILAMLSHSLLQFTDGFGALRPLTRTATPAFVILFGIMLEVAYLRKLRSGKDKEAIEARLISRMLTCYLFFAAITLAAFVTGKLGKMATLKALVFIDGGFLGIILKIYAVLFFIVILFLPLLRRYGANFVLVAAVASWCLKYALDTVLPESHYLVAFIAGSGEGFGPSILPSMTFLAFGLAFGEYLTGRRNGLTAGSLLLLAICIAGFSFWQLGSLAAIGEAWLGSRWINHPLYYAIGICSTSLYLGLFWLAWQKSSVDPVSRFTATMGMQTLFVYGAGNVALGLLPAYSGHDASVATALVITFMSVLLTIAWLRAKQAGWLDQVLFGIPSRYSQSYEIFIGWCSSIVQRTLQVALGKAR